MRSVAGNVVAVSDMRGVFAAGMMACVTGSWVSIALLARHNVGMVSLCVFGGTEAAQSAGLHARGDVSDAELAG